MAPRIRWGCVLELTGLAGGNVEEIPVLILSPLLSTHILDCMHRWMQMVFIIH